MKQATVIAIANYKGGCGKTSTTVNCAYGLAQRDKKVLIIDHDAQSNATFSMGVDLRGSRTLSEALIEGSNLPRYQVTHNIDITPPGQGLLTIDYQLSRTPGRNSRLASLISPIKGSYDYILIDCPPNNGIGSNGSLIAADYLLIPAEAALFSMKGVEQMYKAVEAAKKKNPQLRILGIFITRYRKSKDHDFSLAELRALYGDTVLRTVIREAASISSAQLARQSVYEFAPKSNGSIDYDQLVTEIINKLKITK